jgi:hypothetical protein
MGVASYLQQVVLVSESNSTQEKGKKTSKSQPKLQYNGRGVVNQIKKILPYSQFQTILQSILFKAPKLFYTTRNPQIQMFEDSNRTYLRPYR